MVKADFAHTPLKIRDVTSWIPVCSARSIWRQPFFVRSFRILSPNSMQTSGCNPSSIDLVEALYLVDALSVEKRRKSEGLRTACHPWPLSVTASEGAGVEEVASSYAKFR